MGTLAHISAGQTALITGASSGIGAAFAQELSTRGVHLILVARSRDKLEAVAAQCRARGRVRVDVLPADLAHPDAVVRLGERIDAIGRDVDVLINSAGFGVHGDVVHADPSRLHEQSQLNVTALVDLTRAFLPGMTARSQGVIINLAALSAFLPLPHMAAYAATKAFVLSFTEALWVETRHSGVRVLALCPGPTDTPFHAATGSDDGSFGKHRSPEQVVRTALRAVERDFPASSTDASTPSAASYRESCRTASPSPSENAP
uniref:SDR family NAD(P)-dependent oxidoreductase n=1 Tax=Paractinoplanes polyasparticus TaxID=2856853 RepID=UPI001C84DA02|nr:SDR family oxidoreductase [Actinoplanes polyasparticus]